MRAPSEPSSSVPAEEVVASPEGVPTVEESGLETPPPAPEPAPERGEDAPPAIELDDEALVRGICALVFASPEPLSLGRLNELLERPGGKRVRQGIELLRARLAQSGLPLALSEIAGGYRLLTVPELGSVVARLVERHKLERLSGAALETLAILAYRQPVTKAEVEAIRGVQAGPILRTLIDRGLVRVVGRADQPGHPLQYGTTRDFLDRFGLASLSDLPRDGELARD